MRYPMSPFRPAVWSSTVVLAIASSALLLPFSARAELSSGARDAAAKVLKVNPRDTRRGNEAQQQQMHAIAKKMVCLCGDCPRYNLDECQCGWAQTNRKVIELALLDGKTEQQIMNGYVEAYDLKILDKLPDEGFGKVSYLAPYAVGLLLLGLMIWAGLRSRTTASAPEEVPRDNSEADEILRRELEDLD